MIRLPQGLPALAALRSEGIEAEEYALSAWQQVCAAEHDVVLLLNLMPMKAVTELDLARALAFPEKDVTLLPVKIKGQTYKTTPMSHMQRYYVDIEDVMDFALPPKRLSLIITGAPVEQYAFEDVRYWEALCRVMDWADGTARHTLYICWGAQAGLYHHYGIPKYALNEKKFGIFSQEVLDAACPIMRGLSPAFFMPNSRHTEVRAADFIHPDLKIVAAGRESGVGVAVDDEQRATYIVGHLEYEPHTLENEYKRDLGKGLPIKMPQHYYEGDDASRLILFQWHDAARTFYRNWLDLSVD